MKKLIIDDNTLLLKDVKEFVFGKKTYSGVEISTVTQARVKKAFDHLQALIEKKTPIYGVTTGFGDSCHRTISPDQAEELQRNLVAYLSCGTGPTIPEKATRATFLIRLKSLSRGYSGVSPEFLEKMAFFLENNWTPVVPREGSLGASGDLIPLAYLARALQGQGEIHAPSNSSGKATLILSEVMAQAKVAPYVFKPKEALAMVNGTSTMAGLCLVNLTQAEYLTELAATSTAWLCLALQGRTEAFGPLVNEKAGSHPGQALVAKKVRTLLEAESYRPARAQDTPVKNGQTQGVVQDRYSLRCTPQILGPIVETIDQGSLWLEQEINSTTDNPLISEEGTLEMGGNFYGGYLSHSMDYLKISLANLTDLLDRQLMMLIDEKSNRGLPPNLADWSSLPESDRHLHHGLKGLHQAVSAITSEVMSKAMPNSIFSRSSESHNQDKVSLGMSAAVQCSEMLEQVFTVQSLYLICLAQALDLRGLKLEGPDSSSLYQNVRAHVPFVKRDMALGDHVRALSNRLKELSYEKA
ncbi:MAG: aromatic amino acid lyase [Methylotenera sp.]|nr:aromatic amino acid lyase [Oligoflexia bacterium]